MSTSQTSLVRNATDQEKGTALALITCAVAVFGPTLLGIIALFNVVNDEGRVVLVLGGICTGLLLLLSIMFGALGITHGVKPGPWNRFDCQAKAGLLGLLVLLCLPVGILIFWQAPANDQVDKVNELRKELQEMRSTLTTKLDALDQSADENTAEINRLGTGIKGLRKEIEALKPKD